jgi:DNA-binding CsgD family transcriptional regulator
VGAFRDDQTLPEAQLGARATRAKPGTAEVMTKASPKLSSGPRPVDRASQKRSATERLEADVPIPLQFGERTFWAKRVCDLQWSVGAATSPKVGLPRDVVGQLRVGDLDYALTATSEEPDPTVGSRDPLDVLSEREIQIALLVSRGKVTKQIACNLRISEHTVCAYMRRIFGKLQVSNRAAMVAKVLKCIGSGRSGKLISWFALIPIDQVFDLFDGSVLYYMCICWL